MEQKVTWIGQSFSNKNCKTNVTKFQLHRYFSIALLSEDVDLNLDKENRQD